MCGDALNLVVSTAFPSALIVCCVLKSRFRLFEQNSFDVQCHIDNGLQIAPSIPPLRFG